MDALTEVLTNGFLPFPSRFVFRFDNRITVIDNIHILHRDIIVLDIDT